MEIIKGDITSQYNEAIFQISRLNEIWIACRKFREAGNYKNWNWCLDSAFVELRNDALRIDEKKKTNFIDKIKTLNDKVKEIKVNIFKLNQMDKISDLYDVLSEKEYLLKEIQDKSGKGSKYKDPEEDDFD